ncbi:MAG TPA: GAF domain-containing protein [Candidatus Bathyarchaeia archaeon]|nr:GAF domain-containing protein [Candidatus Bathyarchaeia archaeon]
MGRIKTALSDGTVRSGLNSTVRILRQSSDHYDWVGIYLVKGDSLELAAYDGESETEHVSIPVGTGICGSAAKEGRTIVVADVNKDPRYLACFASTRSEIVVPIIGKNTVLGEIDIDSDRLSAFDAEDRESLEAIARLLVGLLED